MNTMKIRLLLSQQILRDVLLWCLVVAAILLGVVLLLVDQTCIQMCRIADGLVQHYGQEITQQNRSALLKDFNEILHAANNTLQSIYGNTTTDLMDLYHFGCFETEDDYLKAVLMENMLSYDTTTQSDFFSTSHLAGTQSVLYMKLLPLMALSLVIIGVYLMLKALEVGTVTNTSSLEYTSMSGKWIDTAKIKSAFLATTLIWLLITGVVLAVYFLLLPGSVSVSIDAPGTNISELGYLALWLLTEYLVICFFTTLAAAVGLNIRNSLIGVLVLAAFTGVQVWLLKKPQWNPFAKWTPIGLFLAFQDGVWFLRTNQWFQKSTLYGKELSVAGAWLVFSLILLLLSWQRFLRKELKL